MERVGEIHDGEVIETIGERFRACRFFSCQFVGANSTFIDCEFLLERMATLRIEVDEEFRPIKMSITGFQFYKGITLIGCIFACKEGRADSCDR